MFLQQMGKESEIDSVITSLLFHQGNHGKYGEHYKLKKATNWLQFSLIIFMVPTSFHWGVAKR